MVPLERVLGVPWVYTRLRPWLLGGIDLSPVFDLLGETDSDVLLDVGCGTGVALNYLHALREYHGFDPDARAIRYAERTYRASNVHFYNRLLDKADVASIRPTKALLLGLLHHLDAASVRDLLQMLGASQTISQVVTDDVFYAPGRHINNLLARLDRGKFVRTIPGMHGLFQQSPFEVKRSCLSASGNKLALYFIADLRPRHADT